MQGNQGGPTTHQAQHSGLAGAAPVTSGGKDKNPNKITLPPGINVGRVIELVDLGTQAKTYNNQTEMKRMIRIGFEHPQLKQRYYIQDTQDTSCITSKEVNYVISKNSFLKKFIDIMEGRTLTLEEAKQHGADLGKYLGRIICVNIEIKVSKTTNLPYEKVVGVAAFNEQSTRMPEPFEPERETHWWFIDADPQGRVIGENFKSTVFAKLPFYVRKDILASKECKDYLANGGWVAERETNQQNQQGGYQQPQQQQPQQTNMYQQQQPAQQQSPPPPSGSGQPVLSVDGSQMLQPTQKMSGKGYTIAQFLASDKWNVDTLVAQGWAQWVPNPNYSPPAQTQTPPPPGPSSTPAPQGQGGGFQDDDDLPF